MCSARPRCSREFARALNNLILRLQRSELPLGSEFSQNRISIPSCIVLSPLPGNRVEAPAQAQHPPPSRAAWGSSSSSRQHRHMQEWRISNCSFPLELSAARNALGLIPAAQNTGLDRAAGIQQSARNKDKENNVKYDLNRAWKGTRDSWAALLPMLSPQILLGTPSPGWGTQLCTPDPW